ncbi:L-rhamnose isomerase [Escherichia coli]
MPVSYIAKYGTGYKRLIPGPNGLVPCPSIWNQIRRLAQWQGIKPEHFKNWVEWAKADQLGLDFNPSCFSHPLSAKWLYAFPCRRRRFASSRLITAKPAVAFRPILASNSAHHR